MSKNRIIACFMVIILALTVFLTGCTGQKTAGSTETQATTTSVKAETTTAAPETSAAPQEVTVNFTNFSASGDNAKYLDQMKEAFNQQFSYIKINIETIGYGEYFTQMQTRVASNTAPDCYELNYENFVSYAKKSVLKDLDSLFAASGFDSSVINKNALEAFRADGKQYGLPASFSNVLLIYNKDLFDKAGAAYPTKDWTWEDEQKAAEKIRAVDKKTYGISHPIHFWEFYKVVQQNGGSLLSDDKSQFTVYSPQNVETLQVMVDRVLKTNVMPTDAQLGGTGDWDLFKAGRLGMIVTGIWAFPEFTRDCKFKWDVAIEPGKVKKATHFFSNGLVLNKDTKLEQQAFEWIRFMSSGKEAAKIRIDAAWELPAVNYPDILDAFLKQTPPDNRQVVFDSLEYLVTPPVIEQFSEMADIMGKHLQAAKEGKKTPDQALKDAQKELEEKIKLK